jgi:hypothetical protein
MTSFGDDRALVVIAALTASQYDTLLGRTDVTACRVA